MDDSALTEYTALFWTVAAGVALLTAHVGLGWLARARRRPALLESWSAQLLAALTFGTGISAAAVMGMLAEGLLFPLGYGAVAAAVLWLGGVIGSLALVAGLTHLPRGWMVVLAALVLAGLGAGAQAGWVWAAGFRPGVLWDTKYVVAGWAVMFAGSLGALWLAVNHLSRRNREALPFIRRGASLMLGLSLLAGQQLVMAGADLAAQRGSVYRKQLPASLLGVGCGVLVPTTLLIMSLDLSLRNRRRDQQPSSFTPQKRRKRRHRVRTL